MKPSFYLLLFTLGVAVAGCSSDKEQIVFSDEAVAQTGSTNTTVLAADQAPKLAKVDQRKIEHAVYVYLLGRHFFDNGDYTAVFLQTDDAQTALLQSEFPTHVPPIKANFRADLPANRTPIDRDTGKSAMLLSVDVNDPNPDGSVDAIGRWYAGGAVSGFYTFEMNKTGDAWQITTVK